MQNDGNIVLSTQVALPLWASNTASLPVDRIVMQDDSNLVAYSQQGVDYWPTSPDRS
jgi:hypothetical protein